MPVLEELEDLYALGVRPRQGEVMMIAGRSGSQKSGFALWLVQRWNLPTLYFSADMSAFQASTRLACSATGMTTEEVEAKLAAGGNTAREVLDALAGSKVTFSFGSPISWQPMTELIEAHVEMYDAFPAVIVIDNLMDVEDAESDYSMQMAAMQSLHDLARATGATVLILHHASDKTQNKNDPWAPPSRAEVKGGLSEKPELSLSVALNPDTLDFRVACIKQRMGPSDPSGSTYATLIADPASTRFYSKRTHVASL